VGDPAVAGGHEPAVDALQALMRCRAHERPGVDLSEDLGNPGRLILPREGP
jgi:hypothetical protein